MTPEGKLQLKFKTAVKKAGGRSYKFISPANRGVSDQIVWVPGGMTVYAEIKNGNKPLSPLQEVFKRDCVEYGMPHEVIRFSEDIVWFTGKYFTEL